MGRSCLLFLWFAFKSEFVLAELKQGNLWCGYFCFVLFVFKMTYELHRLSLVLWGLQIPHTQGVREIMCILPWHLNITQLQVCRGNGTDKRAGNSHIAHNTFLRSGGFQLKSHKGVTSSWTQSNLSRDSAAAIVEYMASQLLMNAGNSKRKAQALAAVYKVACAYEYLEICRNLGTFAYIDV